MQTLILSHKDDKKSWVIYYLFTQIFVLILIQDSFWVKTIAW